MLLLRSPVGPVDRSPVSNPASVPIVDLMDLAGAPFPMAFRNPNLAAELTAIGYPEVDLDSVMPYFSIVQESSALGCEVQWETKDNWPTVSMTRPLWCEPDDVNLPGLHPVGHTPRDAA